MKILVVGAGGREHAIIKKLKENPAVEKIYCLPGNGGIAADAVCVSEIGAKDIPAQVEFAKAHGIDYAVVAPDDPLALGAVDALSAAGIPCFGPDKKAAVIEASKAFAKDLMQKYNIPTAKYRVFTDAPSACAYIDAEGAPIVVKADGLALGKGVVVAMTVEEALKAVDDMLEGNKFGAAGARVVIEDYLKGEEASFIVACDGCHVLPMATSQDHKRLLDHDRGPNTGGMGAYSPAPVVTDEVYGIVMEQVIRPVIDGMAAEGNPFTGFLYAGLMIGKKPDGKPDVRVLEFNCRMGDPETQPIMSRIRSDVSQVYENAIAGTLDKASVDWDARSALGVVCAAEGYPESPKKGAVIESLPENEESLKVFHAGTAWDSEHRMVVNGGRVLCVVGLGATLREAQSRAYEGVKGVRWNGMQHRSDIGWRALK